jgi:dihydroorotase
MSTTASLIRGIEPDAIAARSGVTTWVDVGSAGAYNFAGLREFVMRQCNIRIVTFLNISGVGLTAPFGEHFNIENCDVDLCCRMVDLHRDIIIGIKARIEGKTVGDNGLEPLRLARQAADRCGLPLMVHIGWRPELDAVLEFLKPGDILTHCFTGGTMRVTAGDHRPHASILAAAQRGVILDVGHGAGSFDFAVAEGMLAAGLAPDVISTDMHQLSVHRPMFDLPTCMSKFLADECAPRNGGTGGHLTPRPDPRLARCWDVSGRRLRRYRTVALTPRRVSFL